MKKLLLVPAALILVCILVFTGCGGGGEATGASGGTLRCISGAIPNNLGYPPEKAPSDNFLMLPVLERLAEWDEGGNMIPVLAESWDVDADAMTITWNLKQSIKFTDGSDWNAEALRWNFQLGIDNNRLTDGQYV